MECNKKGASSGKPTPALERRTNYYKTNYTRVNRLCLGIEIIALIGFLIAYHKAAQNALYLTAGVLITSIAIQCALHPITEEEDNE